MPPSSSISGVVQPSSNTVNRGGIAIPSDKVGIGAAQFIHWLRGTTLLNTAGRGGIAIHSDKVGICATQFIHMWPGITLLNTAGRDGIAIHSDMVGIFVPPVHPLMARYNPPQHPGSPFIQIM